MFSIKKTKFTLFALLLTTTIFAQDQDASGFYLGVGAGWSDSAQGYLINGECCANDEDDEYKSNSRHGRDEGYKVYAGYQFNKIIAIEAAYVNYGTMEFEYYKQRPELVSFSANAGYNLFNAQFRPFALIGLGYLQSNNSVDLEEVDEDFVTVHVGLGVEYYPSVLGGLGFRVAAESNFEFDNEMIIFGEEIDGEDEYIKTNFRRFGTLFASVEYKF